MNFGEIRFWLLLVAGLGVIASLRWLLGRTRLGLPPPFDRLALCTLGMFLLCCVSWLTFAIFMAVGLCSYYGMKWILATHTKGHSYYLFILIPLLLLPLFYYKYLELRGERRARPAPELLPGLGSTGGHFVLHLPEDQFCCGYSGV